MTWFILHWDGLGIFRQRHGNFWSTWTWVVENIWLCLVFVPIWGLWWLTICHCVCFSLWERVLEDGELWTFFWQDNILNMDFAWSFWKAELDLRGLTEVPEHLSPLIFFQHPSLNRQLTSMLMGVDDRGFSNTTRHVRATGPLRVWTIIVQNSNCRIGYLKQAVRRIRRSFFLHANFLHSFSFIAVDEKPCHEEGLS